MITHYPYASLGHANHGWLDARHHFSFGMYHNPARRGFGTLLVINDDRIAAGRGFAPHPHRDMEIITYVREGAITHRDSMGNEGCTEAGDVQVMSAGTGIEHSEQNLEAVDTRLFQIWIEPNQRGVKPRWDSAKFPKHPVTNTLPVLVSGREEDIAAGALMIHQDAAIYAGTILANMAVNAHIKYQAYVLISKGSIIVNSIVMNQGDGAEIMDEKTLHITATTDAEVLVIDAP